MNINKSLMKASNGAPITQSLFLELGYSDYAIYTIKDEDYEHKGKVYPSIKRLYIEMEDIGEYDFATTYFLSWNHWMRICENKQFTPTVTAWREELEIKLRSRAIKTVIAKTQSESGINAAKWVAERGWSKASVGRPSRQEEEREKRITAELDVDYAADIRRVSGGS